MGLRRCNTRGTESVTLLHNRNGIPCAASDSQRNIVVETVRTEGAAPCPTRTSSAAAGSTPAGGATDEVLNPATGEVLAEVPASGAEDVDAAVEAAAAAFDEWSTMTPRGRSERLHKVADAIEADLDTIKRIEMENCGKPASMIEFEMDLTVDNWRFFAGGARFLEGRAGGRVPGGPHVSYCAATRSASSARSRRGTTRSTWRRGSSGPRSPPATPSC